MEQPPVAHSAASGAEQSARVSAWQRAGHRIELEADKLNLYHAKAMIELLAIGEEHHHTAE